MTLSLELAERVSALSFGDLPRDALHAAELSLADALCVMLAAVRLEPATDPFHRHAHSGGRGPSTLLAGGTATPALAALANGTLAHALDFEDTYDAAGLHPNAVIIPAALALSEAEGSSGADFLLAIVAGCDAACRLGDALAADPAARGWYHPPMIAAAGAAFGAARLLGLTPEHMVSAVALALCQFSLTDELKRSPRSSLRVVRDGFAAKAVVEACLLARAGVTGVEAPLEGESGLFRMLTGEGPAGDVLAGFGTSFAGTRVTLKQWPSCRGTHPYIALALELRDRGILAGQIDSLSLSVKRPDDMLMLPETDRRRPATIAAAKFSIPYCFALGLHAGRVDLDGFSDSHRTDDTILSVASKIRLDEVLAYDDRRAPEARLRLTDGRELTVVVPDPPVIAAALTSFSDIDEKLQDCLTHAGRPKIKADLLRAITALRNSPSLMDLSACVRSQPMHR
ncbi:MAG: MmgE/PrpD family protein [Oricola sp.]